MKKKTHRNEQKEALGVSKERHIGLGYVTATTAKKRHENRSGELYYLMCRVGC